MADTLSRNATLTQVNAGRPGYNPGGPGTGRNAATLTQVNAPAVPVPAVASAPAPGSNPFAPGGVIPPTPSPEAIAAFHQSLGGTPRVVAAPAPAAVDPMAGQIRFVDQNSPRVAAPNIIRGGIPGAGGGEMTQRAFAATTPLITPPRSASERAQHAWMDIQTARHANDLALANGDPVKTAAANDRFESAITKLVFPTFGTTSEQTAAAAQQ